MSPKLPRGPVTLVRAAGTDEEFLAELYIRRRSGEFARIGWDEAMIRQVLLMQYDLQKRSYEMQFPAAEIFVIQLKNEPVGRLIVNRNPAEIRLVDIALLPEFRGAGIGTQVITGLLAEAREKDRPVALRVAPDNQAALRLYRKMGFQITGADEINISMEWRADARPVSDPVDDTDQ